MTMKGLQRCTVAKPMAKPGHPSGYASSTASALWLLARERKGTHRSHSSQGRGGQGELWCGCACSAPFDPLRMRAAHCNAAACTGNAMPFAHTLVNTLCTNTPHAACVHHVYTRGRGKDFARANIVMQIQHIQGGQKATEAIVSHVHSRGA